MPFALRGDKQGREDYVVEDEACYAGGGPAEEPRSGRSSSVE